MLNLEEEVTSSKVKLILQDQKALIWDSPVTNTMMSMTYSELQEQVQKLAKVYENLGVKAGDRVVICKLQLQIKFL
jgi:propionyl-CoA synthetase